MQSSMDNPNKIPFLLHYIGRQIFLQTAVLAPLLLCVFASYLTGLTLALGVPPGDHVPDFMAAGAIGLVDKVILLWLVASAFIVLGWFIRWLLCDAKTREVDQESIARSNPLSLLSRCLLGSLGSVLRLWLRPPACLKHLPRRNLTLLSTFSGLLAVCPLWNRPPPAGAFA